MKAWQWRSPRVGKRKGPDRRLIPYTETLELSVRGPGGNYVTGRALPDGKLWTLGRGIVGSGEVRSTTLLPLPRDQHLRAHMIRQTSGRTTRHQVLTSSAGSHHIPGGPWIPGSQGWLEGEHRHLRT